MTIKDDYYDVLAALSGKPEKKQFENIWNNYCQIEKELNLMLEIKKIKDVSDDAKEII
jgi:hypothetical protein